MWLTYVTLTIISLALVTHGFGNGNYFEHMKLFMKRLNWSFMDYHYFVIQYYIIRYK